MIFSKAFFVLSFAALALAVPVAEYKRQDAPTCRQAADAGTFCFGRPFGTNLIRLT